MSCEREEKERPLVKDHVMPPCELFARTMLSLLCPQTIPTCRGSQALSTTVLVYSYINAPFTNHLMGKHEELAS
ncbi:hypothetical protein JHK84_038040 [Glycine max]|nr:hypothetical protein JHK86_037827 [Glycine max]KAG5131643.1 hypothetical protein JHK84_038040 [Glycine max]